MNAVLNPPQPQQITLYFKEGSSDKVYQCAIEPAGDLFVVNFAYGRRGTTLQTGTKTSAPVSFDSAQKVYDKLVREKMAKGYTVGEAGTPYQHTEKADRVTNILPQLLNPIEESEVHRLIKDPGWCLQEKKDGKRTLVQKEGAAIHGINRKGLLIGLPSPIVLQVHKIPGDLIFDGECVGDVLYIFDLLQLGGGDLRQRPYEERWEHLMKLLEPEELTHLELVDAAFTPARKALLFKQLKEEKREGVVLKRLDAPYSPGRPNTGGPQLKHKFCATVSAVVSKVNLQRSVELRLLNGDGWQTVGNVTIPANAQIPGIGEVVEVRYLYAFPESNALYQPVFLGPRIDIGKHECVLSQLKYKPDDDEN